MRVDAAGQHEQPPGIDHPLAVRHQPGRELDDPTGTDAHVRPAARLSGHDRSAADQQAGLGRGGEAGLRVARHAGGQRGHTETRRAHEFASR